jgi:retron-type reverse transcriptase
VADRALQRSTAQVRSAIYEQDFLPCSFGGRPGLSAHHALATLHEVIAGRKVGWVLEADLQNFFDGISHDWLLAHIPMDTAMLRQWLKAGFVDQHVLSPTEAGVPQGGIASPGIANLICQHFSGQKISLVFKAGS